MRGFKIVSENVKLLLFTAYSKFIGLNHRYKKIILSGFSIAFVRLFGVALNLVTVPMTLSYLGNERYGIWLSISSAMSLLSFADLGLGNGLLNEITKANARKNILEVQKAISSGFFLLTGVALFLLGVFFMFRYFVNWAVIFNVQTGLSLIELDSSISVIVVMIILNIPLGVVQRIHEGNQEGFKFQFWLLVGSLISFGFLIFSINNQFGLPILVLSLTSGPLLATILNAVYLFIIHQRELRPKWELVDFHLGKRLVKSGLSFFVLGVFTLIGNSSDDIVIAHMLGNSEIASYEIVKKMFLVTMMTQFLIQPMWPAFGDAIESKDFAWAQKTLWNGLLISVCAGGIIALPLMFWGGTIISYWLSIDYTPSFGLSFGFFAFVLLANYGGVMSTFFNSGPLMKKQIRMIIMSSISALILKVLLSIKFGISGIIWGTVIGYGLFYIIPSFNLAHRFFKSQNEGNN